MIVVILVLNLKRGVIMTIYNVNDKKFKKYGQVLEGYDLRDFVSVLEKTPMPESGVVYVASDETLEQHPIFEEFQDIAFGGIPMQIGYCNGYNSKLNCLEYHKSSELCIMVDDTILLLGMQSDIENLQYDTSKVEAFLIPAGTGVELYSTALHYAPCCAKTGQGFKVAICLPKGTNCDPPDKAGTGDGENKLLRACNKWLLAHEDSPEAKSEAYIGLFGENITL